MKFEKKQCFNMHAAVFIFLWMFSAVISHNRLLAEDQPSSFVFCYISAEPNPDVVGRSKQPPEFLPNVSIDLIKLIGAQANLTPVLVGYPWERCLSLLSNGRVDSVIASYSEARASIGRYPMKLKQPDDSRRIATAAYYLYQFANRPQIWDGSNFINDNVRIGAPLGYSIVAELQRKNIDVIEVASSRGLLTLLQRGRIDGVAAPELAADSLIRHSANKFANITKVKMPLMVKAYFLVFSHHFAERFPRATERLWDSVKIVRERTSEMMAK